MQPIDLKRPTVPLWKDLKLLFPEWSILEAHYPFPETACIKLKRLIHQKTEGYVKLVKDLES